MMISIVTGHMFGNVYLRKPYVILMAQKSI